MTQEDSIDVLLEGVSTGTHMAGGRKGLPILLAFDDDDVTFRD